MQKEKYIRRFNILRGQIEGITKMMDAEEDCEKILTQIKAVKNGFSSVSAEMMKEFFSECLLSKDPKKAEKLLEMFSKM